MYKVLFFLLVSNMVFAQNRMFPSQNGGVINGTPQTTQVALSLVGGGGGGGGDIGGGGGGGQVLNIASYSILGKKSLTITVAGQTTYPNSYNNFGKDGGNSSVAGGLPWTVTALGGNGGRGRGVAGTNIGWNGGGGSYDFNTANAGQGGFAGGNSTRGASGGGGGSGGVGQSATSNSPGNGGLGMLSGIDGLRYGGGGGGALYQGVGIGLGTDGGGNGGGGNNGNGKDASINTGGGGGGGPSSRSDPNAGRGASGIVMIKYLGSPMATGGDITQSGGYTIHTFKTSGSFVLN